MDKVENILKELLAAAGIPYSNIERSSVAGQEIFAIRTDDARTLIGAHGDTVYALDFLVKKIYENGLPAPAPREKNKRFAGQDIDDGGARPLVPIRCRALPHEHLRTPHHPHHAPRCPPCEDGIAGRRAEQARSYKVGGRLINRACSLLTIETRA